MYEPLVYQFYKVFSLFIIINHKLRHWKTSIYLLLNFGGLHLEYWVRYYKSTSKVEKTKKKTSRMVTNIKADAIVGTKTKEIGILPFENIALKDI